MTLASDDLEHVVVVPGRHFAPTASSGSAAAVSGDEVEGDLAQQGEVAGGGAVAHPAVILAEGDVENPVRFLAAFGDQAASRNLRSSRSRWARPYIWRLSAFSRLICPSAGPLLQSSVTAARTAS
jgi:hypothetical protein